MKPALGLGFFMLGAMFGGGALYLYARRSFRRYAKLLSFAAHEINTPVTSLNLTILNFVQGVFGPLSKEHAEWMQMLREQTLRVASLVGDLRDLLHIELHRDFKPEIERFQWAVLITDTLAAMQGSFTRGGTRIETHLGRDLPEIRGDKDRMQRVLINIFMNARKFQNGGVISAFLQKAPEDQAELTVTYQGSPISPAEARQMLLLDYPVRRRPAQTLPCVGLGLGICRVLVERQGGSMSFDVDPRGLSKVQIRMPLAGPLRMGS